MMKMQKRGVSAWVYIVVAVVILIGAGATYVLLRQSPQKQTAHTPSTTVSTPSSASKSVQPQPANTLRFAAMGDMLAHDSVVKNAKTANGYDFTKYFQAIRPSYKDADVVFCNPETLAAGEPFGISGYPSFNAPLEFSRDLNAGAGCNLINLATNHIGDKSQAAINATLDNWEKQKPLAVTGAYRSADEQQTVKYFTKNGLKVAFLAFADFSNNKSVSPTSLTLYHNTALVTKLMNEARKNADVVIVSAHWGTEDSNVVNADQKSTAKLLSSLGADVIIGTGPHVLQSTESIPRANAEPTLVWYSIGNMLSTQLTVNQLTGGIAQFTIAKKDNKVSVTDVAFTPTFMSYDWSATEKTAGNLLARNNLQLQPLSAAQSNLAKHGTSIENRNEYIKSTVSSGTPVVIK